MLRLTFGKLLRRRAARRDGNGLGVSFYIGVVDSVR